MLVLFDIDGTMLSSEGVGVRSIEETCEIMFGKPISLDGIPIGGRLDPLIWFDVCSKYDIERPSDLHEEFRERYTKVLTKNIESIEVKAFRGVKALIENLLSMNGVSLGIVTGNYEETGRIKLEAAGFDPSLFTSNAWGTDGLIRNELPPHAIKQSGEKDVVLLGDTIHDVESGKLSGCRVIAVCTGSHERGTLATSEPDLLLEDLGETEAIICWMNNMQTQ